MGELAAGPIAVDLCGACGGVWLDADELRKLGKDEAALLSGTPSQRVPEPGFRACPRCPGLTPLRPREEKGVLLDECGSCGGIWLDAGELEPMRGRRRRFEATVSPGSSGSAAAMASTGMLDVVSGAVDLVASLWSPGG